MIITNIHSKPIGSRKGRNYQTVNASINGYFAGLEEWRIKDGDTVIGCSPKHPRAKPIADAYQQLFAERDAEYAAEQEWYAEMDRKDAEQAQQRDDDRRYAKTQSLYDF